MAGRAYGESREGIMWKVRVLALSLVALCACQPLENMEDAVAKVHFDRATSMVHVDATFENVSADYFSCTLDEPAAACVDHIREFMAEKPGDTMSNVQSHLARRGDHLDVSVSFDDAAFGDGVSYPMVSGVSVQRHGLFRRPELVVDMDPARTVDGLESMPHKLLSKGSGDEDSPTAVLDRHIVDVTTHTQVDADVTPILTAIPGLDQALLDAKLL